MVESNNRIKIGNHFYIFLHNKLGNGAFGEIYLGKNIKTGQDVAIESTLNSFMKLNFSKKYKERKVFLKYITIVKHQRAVAW